MEVASSSLVIRSRKKSSPQVGLLFLNCVSDEARKEHPRSGRNSPAEDFGAPCACRSASRRVKRASLVIRSRKKAVRSRAAFLCVGEMFSDEARKEHPLRRSKDRCAPSRAAARDIRPLVLLLLSEKSHAASLLLACERARDAPTCYQLFSVSSGQADFIFTNRCCCERFSVSGGQVLYFFLSAYKERTRSSSQRSLCSVPRGNA